MDEKKQKQSTTDEDLEELLSTNKIEGDTLKMYQKYLIRSFRMVNATNNNSTKKNLGAVIEVEGRPKSLFLPDYVKQIMPENIVQKLESGEKVELHKKFYLVHHGKTASGDIKYEFAI